MTNVEVEVNLVPYAVVVNIDAPPMIVVEVNLDPNVIIVDTTNML